MAVWGFPLAIENDVEHAAKAAFEIRDRICAWNLERAAQGKFTIRVCSAIHRGRVIAGQVGSAGQIDITFIGDAVNVASRVEQLTKILPADILITEEARLFTSNRIPTASLGMHRIRGRKETIAVFGIGGLKPENNAPLVPNYSEMNSTPKKPNKVVGIA